ncbi:hypothetical protein K492DRAFT_143702 [Lichtheimia hyalospora FSU 10163]|nr:hypothetical protein K492DRAFT_143702 [Lichtheimia hyalospora FSU 10163]
MPPSALESVLRYAYIHGYTCRQWAEPVRDYKDQVDGDISTELCELLLGRFFAQTRVAEPLLERYIAYAATGDDEQHFPLTLNPQECLIPPITFLSCLVKFVDTTAIRNPHQWSHLLKCLPTLLSVIDTDQVISDLLQQKDQQLWPRLLCNVFIMLSRLVAVGLYYDYYARDILRNKHDTTIVASDEAAVAAASPPSSQQFNNTQTSSSYPFNFPLSQPSGTFDPDATLDLESFAAAEPPTSFQASAASTDGHTARDSTQMSITDTDRIETANAILAAQVMEELVEKKSAKRIFEIMNTQNKREAGKAEEPWATCQAILAPPSAHTQTTPDVAQNTHIQKLLLLINRLTDRDLDRRMAVHLKYQELEDEGTARALPSAGLMGFLYHLVQIRPGLSEEYILDYLTKMQTIKGSFDESFYLEIWFAALTGLREASDLGHNQHNMQGNDGVTLPADVTVNANRLLWRSMVLVKVPFIIEQLYTKKQNQSRHYSFLKRENDEHDTAEMNPLEASLRELKSFTGLLKGCSPSFAALDILEPGASKLLDQINNGNKAEKDDGDDFMNLINDMSNTVDFNTPAVAKAIRHVASEDIFTQIVRVCQQYGLVQESVAEILVTAPKTTEIKSEQKDDGGMDIIDDTMMLDFDGDNQDATKSNDMEVVAQNVDQRMNALRETISMSGITELLHIAFACMAHTKKIVDFVVELLRDKAESRDIYGLAKICDALNKCPCAIDLIEQLHHPLMLLEPLEQFCNEWKPSDSEMDVDNRSNSESDNDDDMDGVRVLYGKFGKVWTLVVLIVRKFNLYRDIPSVFRNEDGFLYRFFMQGPLIYGVDATDETIEEFAREWQTALLGNGGISDDLLRFSTPQQLLQAAPTLIARAILVYENGHLGEDTLMGIVSYFQESFLNFTLCPITIMYLCDHVLMRNPSVGVKCLHQLLMQGRPPHALMQISGSNILGALMGLSEQLKQERIVRPASVAEKGQEAIMALDELITQLQAHIKNKLGIEEKSEQKQHHTETVSTGVTCDNLAYKAQEMFRYIVKSGRSMFMRDVDADVVALWDPCKAPKSVIVHYLDMVMFQMALNMGGPHWFVNMIVEQVLEAGKSGGAVRAAELGSCLITTPLTVDMDSDGSCYNLLRCLLQDVVPSFLEKCASANASFFQGQTLGVFTGNCLVLMHDRGDQPKERQFVDEFGRQFFETLVVDNENAPQMIQPHGNSIKREEDNKNDQSIRLGVFGSWPDTVTESPVWRGFLKGLMSNPLVNEAWPNTFIY